MDFSATYDPNRTLTASMQANALGGGLNGNFDFSGMLDDIMGRAAWWKNRQANAADARAEAMRGRNVSGSYHHVQNQAGGVETPSMPLRDLFQTNEALRSSLEGASNTAGSGVGQNAWWNTLPMAGTVSRVQTPQKTGWDWYAQMAQAGAGPSAAAVETAGRQKQGLDSMSPGEQYMQAMRMYQPDTYAQMMQPKPQAGR